MIARLDSQLKHKLLTLMGNKNSLNQETEQVMLLFRLLYKTGHNQIFKKYDALIQEV